MDGIMPLKPIKDIDQEVQLPKELEFRADAVWNKIQSKKERSPSKAIIYWFGAASVTLILSLFLFGNENETVIDDSQMATGRTTKDVIFDPKIQKTPHLRADEKPKQKEIIQKPLSEKIIENLEVLDEDSTLTNSSRNMAQTEVLQLEEPEMMEEKPKELSPAALHLQKSLAKLNKDKSTDQVVFVEKFNLLNELNVGKVQAYTNPLPNSVFQSIKKESNERN